MNQDVSSISAMRVDPLHCVRKFRAAGNRAVNDRQVHDVQVGTSISLEQVVDTVTMKFITGEKTDDRFHTLRDDRT